LFFKSAQSAQSADYFACSLVNVGCRKEHFSYERFNSRKIHHHNVPGGRNHHGFRVHLLLYKSERMLPSTTLIASGREHDRISNLDQPGAFRRTIGISKNTIQSLFGTAKVDITSHDFTALDITLPPGGIDGRTSGDRSQRLVFPEGGQRLTGEQALTLARLHPVSVFQRAGNQNLVMCALRRQIEHPKTLLRLRVTARSPVPSGHINSCRSFIHNVLSINLIQGELDDRPKTP
jgi:hypothetical protein